MKNIYKRSNDSLDDKYQRLETRNQSISWNGYWMDKTESNNYPKYYQSLNFHMDFNDSILQDPSSLTKNVASTMGSKAVMSGDAVNVGTKGVIA